jgi:hypothetical protein
MPQHQVGRVENLTNHCTGRLPAARANEFNTLGLMTTTNLKTFLVLAILILARALPTLAEVSPPPPVKYEMKLVYIFEGKEPEYIFVIGNSGFKSIGKLKSFLGGLTPGSEITWSPGCERFGKEPLLSSDKEMKEFRKFLEGKGIKFNLVPAG